MTTLTHEKVIAETVQNILLQRQKMIDNLPQDAAKFVQQIKWQGTSRIILRDEPGRKETSVDGNLIYPKRCPDASFQYDSTKYPQVVLEVAYSQMEKNLPNIAESYIIGSAGNIRVVVGINLNYLRKNTKGPKTKLATLSIWRPKFWLGDDGKKYLKAEQVIQQVSPFISVERHPR